LGKITITPSIELFNAFNNDVVLSRARNAGAASFNRIEELISPRILRMGGERPTTARWRRPIAS
jgi:hypothetical protein